MKRERAHPAKMFMIAAAILLLSVGYFCSYRAALVVPDLPRPDGSSFLFGPPQYRIDSPWVERFFYPAHVVDHYLWPDGWLYLPKLGEE